ncbi:hypothetical protein CDAR_389981 [Caerostris darwini]|uniref:Ycf15 n=1 Tax=Caerostris darwini TaxID=1538125 RepID=A0AAV4QVX5_9ARAC|nr:hypothetical protein CDAR_389981 [Caerostris darwini]
MSACFHVHLFRTFEGSTEQLLAVTCISSSPTPELPLKPLWAPGGVALSSIHWGKERSRNQISRGMNWQTLCSLQQNDTNKWERNPIFELFGIRE